MSEQVIYAQQISVPYTYTAGAAQRAFLTGLVEGRIVGIRAADGRVIVPPVAHSSDGTPTGEFVEVADTGTVTGWTVTGTAADRTIFALIQLDGADTSLLHLLEAAPEELSEGMRVRARWAEDREPEITAIDAFVPA